MVIKTLTVLLICLAFFALTEAATRLLFPQINLQGTDHSLLQENRFGETFGWRPLSSGTCFGRRVFIDNYGFRRLESPPDYSEAWLLLGDSVTFGVGLAADDTFAGLLQARYPAVKVWNTAVLGYSFENYRAVADGFFDSEPQLRKVLLFLCLNDIYPGPNVQPENIGFLAPLLSFLRRSSKFYMLIKNLFFDRSESYFIYDFEKFRETNPDYLSALAALESIYSSALEKGLEFTVVMLPYEYQLRMGRAELRKPQQMLADFFREKNISYLDAFDCLSRVGVNSRELYLYADAMHLSVGGHRAVYELIEKNLGSGMQ